MIDLKEASNKELMTNLKEFRREENQALAEIVRYLAEVDSRGSFREAGYSSLFTFCTEYLGYSEGGAARRVRAARCLQRSPQVYEQLKSGAITLCSLSEVALLVTDENQELILNSIRGASKREAQRVAESFGAAKPAKRSSIRARKVLLTPPVELKTEPVEFAQAQTPPAPITEERYTFSFEVSAEVKALYDQAIKLVGHVKPEELFEKLLKGFVNKETKAIKPSSIVKQSDPQMPLATQKRSRFIPLKTRREVRERDGCQCSYVSSEGKRCQEQVGLEFDHIQPFSQGGVSQASNLRLLCKAHNQLHAEECFGREFMRYSTSGSKAKRRTSAKKES